MGAGGALKQCGRVFLESRTGKHHRHAEEKAGEDGGRDWSCAKEGLQPPEAAWQCHPSIT